MRAVRAVIDVRDVRNRKFKRLLLPLTALLLIFCLAVPVSAGESGPEGSPDDPPDDPLDGLAGDLWEAVPEDLRPLLPEGVETGDAESIVREMDGKSLIKLMGAFLKDASGQALKMFASLLSVVLLGTLAERLGELMGGDHTKIFAWIFTLCAGLLIFSDLLTLWKLTREVLDEINGFMTALTALMSALYLAGGNTLTAAVHTGWISWLLLLAEKFAYVLLLPVLELSFSGTLISSVAGSLNLRPFVKSVRQFAAALITLVMTVLSVIMTFQTTLSAAADSAAMRAMKFAAAGSVPVIGGLVSESVRTLSGGISTMKGIVGTVGVAVVILLSLSPFLTLLMAKWVFSLGEAVARAAGGDTVASLIADAASLTGYLLAVLTLFDLFFIYSLSVFVRTVAA